MAWHDYGSWAGWWDLFDHTSRCICLWLEVSDTGNMFLFRCPRDPRTMRFAIGNIAHPDEGLLLRTSPNTIKEGHYIIYKRGNSISARSSWTYMLDNLFRQEKPEIRGYLAYACIHWIQTTEPFYITDLHSVPEQHAISCKLACKCASVTMHPLAKKCRILPPALRCAWEINVV